MSKTQIKSEKGITLASLVIYVLVFTMILGLIATLTSYIYRNLGELDSENYSSAEFNRFNINFVKDVKNNVDVKITKINPTSPSNYQYKIVFTDGVNYDYIKAQNALYRNKVKIARNISKFEAERKIINGKVVVRVNIATGKDNNTNFGKKIKYVLKYW